MQATVTNLNKVLRDLRENRGVELAIQGTSIQVFYIQDVVYALEMIGRKRTEQTVRKWIPRGVIPSPLLKHRNRTVFTINHIRAILITAEECDIMQGYDMSDFIPLVWKRMKVENEKIKQLLR